MKFQRIAGRLAAGVMTGAVLLTTFGGTALAATGATPLEKMEYTKVVTTDGHTYAPKTSFSFTLTPVDHSKDTTQATFEGNVVLSGVEGGLTLKAGTITFTPSGSTPDASYSGKDEITWNMEKFNTPGVYHYRMQETVGSYEGIVYDATVYDIYAVSYTHLDVYKRQAGGPLAVLVITVIAAECGKLVSKETKIDILVTPGVTIFVGVGLAAVSYTHLLWFYFD